jgi:hypothetical protein
VAKTGKEKGSLQTIDIFQDSVWTAINEIRLQCQEAHHKLRQIDATRNRREGLKRLHSALTRLAGEDADQPFKEELAARASEIACTDEELVDLTFKIISGDSFLTALVERLTQLIEGYDEPVELIREAKSAIADAQDVLDKSRALTVEAEQPPEWSSEAPSQTSAGYAAPSRALRVFLCHASDDKPSVRRLYHQLRADGIDPWLDEEELLPGQDWRLEIAKAVRDSDAVLVCLSRGSVTKAGYVQKEIKFALDVADEQPEGTIFIIPLRLEKCKVPERLSRWQWVDLFSERGYKRLILALEVRADTLGTTH